MLLASANRVQDRVLFAGDNQYIIGEALPLFDPPLEIWKGKFPPGSATPAGRRFLNKPLARASNGKS